MSFSDLHLGVGGPEKFHRTPEGPKEQSACDSLTPCLSPSLPGFNSVATARIFYKLMLRLGFQEFYLQGGDWGSLICTNMAQLVPR